MTHQKYVKMSTRRCNSCPQGLSARERYYCPDAASVVRNDRVDFVISVVTTYPQIQDYPSPPLEG
jgi:hypothetical protein